MLGLWTLEDKCVVEILFLLLTNQGPRQAIHSFLLCMMEDSVHVTGLQWCQSVECGCACYYAGEETLRSIHNADFCTFFISQGQQRRHTVRHLILSKQGLGHHNLITGLPGWPFRGLVCNFSPSEGTTTSWSGWTWRVKKLRKQRLIEFLQEQ